MAEQIVILIERKSKKHFNRFIELFRTRSEISLKELRSKIPKYSFYYLILKRIHAVNNAIKNIDPNIEPFIAPTLNESNGKIIQAYKRNCEIEIMDDQNFYYLRVKCNGDKHA